MADAQDGCAAIQRDLDRPEKQADRTSCQVHSEMPSPAAGEEQPLVDHEPAAYPWAA